MPLDMRAQFAHQGHIQLKSVLAAEDIEAFAGVLRPLMETLNPNREPLAERSTYRQAFNQVTNLWQHSEAVRTFVFRSDLARLAAEIMGVKQVRLYHDQALFKEAGGGPTPWHVDQVYWPMDTDKTCTFWIPLQAVSAEMGPLAFATGSHQVQGGREMVISEASEAFFSRWVKEQGFPIARPVFELGDISVHAGWTVHHTGPNSSSHHREVMTIIYMDAEARLKRDLTDTQKIDRDVFTPGIVPGGILDGPLTPLLG